MTQSINHEEGNARLASQHMDHARGIINFRVKQIELAVHQLRQRGWEGDGANAFYRVAADLIAGARKVLGKMEEVRVGLTEADRSYSDVNQQAQEAAKKLGTLPTGKTYSING